MPRPVSAAVSLAVLAALAVLSVLSIQPPAAKSTSAPPGEFSANRAYAAVREIGKEVHVTGSAAAGRVRQYIVDQLTDDGLQPEVQDATGRNAGKFGEGAMAHVVNVVATVPGTNSTGRVILMAHYDSVQVSYGANDDGAGVAALLEIARALKQGPAPRNDIVFVFTDAEEACLCGAEAFVNQHPIARDPAVVLNLEARGSSGPAVMFETSTGNSALISAFGRSAPYPVGTSVAVEVYRLLSNDTDFTPVLKAGRFTGLNSAYIDGSSVYHSPQDNPTTMDLDSLQHHGDNALALAREFGRVDLAPFMRPSSSDATYFPVPGLLVRYPGWLVWPFAVLALATVVMFAWLARRRGLTSWPRVLAGFGLAFVPLIGAAVAAQAFWVLLVAIRPGYAQMIDPHRPLWFRFASAALTLAVLALWYALSRRRVGPVALAIGAFGLLGVLGVAFAALIPGGSYLVALPALAGAGAGIGALYRWRAQLRVAGAAVAVLVLAPAVALFFPALGLATGAAPALFATLLGLAVLPVLEMLWRTESAPRARLIGSVPALIAAALAVVLTVVGFVDDRFDRAGPLPTHLMYALDLDTGTARWVSREKSPGPWTRQYVNAHANLAEQFPVLPAGELSVGPATAADLPAPEVIVESESTSDGQRTVRLKFTSARPVRFLAFYGDVGDHRVVSASVEGHDAPTYIDNLNRFGIEFHGPDENGISATLVLKDTGPLRLRLVGGSDGLDTLPGFKARPADVGVVGSHSSELCAVAKTYTI